MCVCFCLLCVFFSLRTSYRGTAGSAHTSARRDVRKAKAKSSAVSSATPLRPARGDARTRSRRDGSRALVQRVVVPGVRPAHGHHLDADAPSPRDRGVPPDLAVALLPGHLVDLRAVVDVVPVHHRAPERRGRPRHGRRAPPGRAFADHEQPQVQPGLDVPVVRRDPHGFHLPGGRVPRGGQERDPRPYPSSAGGASSTASRTSGASGRRTPRTSPSGRARSSPGTRPGGCSSSRRARATRTGTSGEATRRARGTASTRRRSPARFCGRGPRAWRSCCARTIRRGKRRGTR